jgi:DNA-binding SARP family transcriptional activator
MTHLFIHLLGPFEARLNGEPITGFRSDKVRALLAYLCVESQGAHRREKLAGLLWPDFPESDARANLRWVLSDLRKMIGDRSSPENPQTSANFLRITRQTVQSNPESETWVDVHTFLNNLEASHPTIADLEAGVTCCRGEFMAGFSIPDSMIFEEWLLFQRERFARLALEAYHRLADAYTAQGEYARALPHAWRQVELDPLREKAHRQLMRLLAYDGQITKSLAQYENYRALLLEEIGIDPSEETTALYRQIRDGRLAVPEHDRTRMHAFLVDEGVVVNELAVFVDRECELTRLDQSLKQVLTGQGQVLFIVGEPGSGKSVLASEFIRQAMASKADLLAVSGRCNAYTGVGDPYLPFREMMGMLTGDVETKWAGGEITGQQARRLWDGLAVVLQAILVNGKDMIDRLIPGTSLLARAQAAAPSEAAQLQALFEERKFYRSEKAKLQQTDLFEQYTKVLQVLSQKRPLILMVDDLQWADPGSIGLLFHLGRRLRGSRILLIGAYRPEEVAMGRPSADLGMERHPLETVIHEFQREFGEIIIDLAETEGRGFVEAFLDTEPNRLERDFREVFYQHTGGHPLFSVELLRGLQARGDLIKDESGRWVVKSDLDWQTLPARVEAVIDERFWRLPDAWRSILTAASVEGEVFTAEAVARVLKVDEAQVLGCLSGPLTHKHHLVQAQDLEWLGDQRLSHYRFRHFLFQKYLYDQLDPVQVAHYHQQMGSALESLYGDHAGKLAVALAWHFESAGMKLKAAEYLCQAGNLAVQMFAFEEAITHFRHGLDLIKSLPETPQRDQVEIFILLALGLPFGAVKGPTDVESEQIYGRVRQLTQKVEPSFELFQALLGLKEYYDLRLELETALNLGYEMRKLAQYLDKPELFLLAHHEIGVTHLYSGRADEFLKQQQRVLALYNAEFDKTFNEKLGYDLLTDTLIGNGWVLWFLGYADQSEESYQKVFNLLSKAGQPYVKANAFTSAAYHYVSLSDVACARDMSEKAIALSKAHGYSFFLGGALGPMGWVLGEEGQLAEGINLIHHGLTILKDIGSWLLYQQELSMLADTYRKAGKFSEGLAVIEEALVMVNEKGFLLEEPEIHRIRGELLLLEGRSSDEAQVCFQRGIEAARKLKAKSWELRATMSLCRLLRKQGKREQAKGLLIDIYGWFTEGFDTHDLKEAKALLEALSLY